MMKNLFYSGVRYSVTEANTNFYATPFVHPTRIMKEYDFIYLLQGKWKLGQNKEEFELTEDSLLILAANNLHYGVTPCEANTKTMYFHVFFEDEELEDKHTLNGDTVNLESLIDVSLNKNVKKCFSSIVNNKLSGNQRKADIYFELLLCELSENHLYIAETDIANKIKNIIHSNPERFFSNAELADMTNVSVKSAETKFKTMFGVTIHQYILKFKMEEAISYFKRFPQISIKETAYNLGFYDEYHFSKQFKKITGSSPFEFRAAMSEGEEEEKI